MREQIDQLWSYVREAWRFRWYALGVAWLVAVVGWAASFQMPNQYEASAQVHVDTESLLKPLLRGLVVQSDTQRQVELMTRTLLSHPNLEQLARDTDLDLQAETQSELDQLINRLERRIKLSGTGRTNLYRITYRGEDPRLARDVVQALLNMLVEGSLGRSRQDTESAQAFLGRKVEEYKSQLDNAEEQLVQYKREHVGELPGSRGDYSERLQKSMTQLEEARFKLETAQSREKELEEQLTGETPVFGIMDQDTATAESGGTPEFDRRISNLNDKLDTLLLKYTEQHPSVASLKDRLAQLKQQRAQKRARQAAAARNAPRRQSNPLEQNPVYQEIRGALAQTRAQVAATQSEVTRYRQKTQELRAKIDTIPGVEARLRELERKVKTAQTSYDELLDRQRTADISEEASDAENQVEFRVVEPPRVPTDPVSPNRPMLVTASLGAAALGSGAFSLVLALIWPSFHNRAGLYSALQMPVLGAIGRIDTSRERHRRWLRICLYTLTVAALILAYAGVLVMAMGWNLPLESF